MEDPRLPGAEPVPEGLGLVHEEGRSIRATWRGAELFRYVYVPWEPQMESPRPYFHPLRTLGGDLVSLYRPHDHVWHKGIAWSLCSVGSENFWGGPTYIRGHGYRQLPNNGRMRHQGFDAVALHDGVLRIDERLSWITEAGVAWIQERRRIGVTALPDHGAWVLAFESAMHNVSGGTISIGSPTTHGRPDAGYSGLFWRGPRSFTDGRVVTPDGEGGDEFRGWRGPWMGFAGRHDGHDGASTLLFRDHPDNFCFPTQWFVRSRMFACLCPAPFFDAEYPLADDDSLTLRYSVCVADGALGVSGCERLAARCAERDPNTWP
ncbi:MAG: hypothetical protein GEV03_07990 [Streptosporangiales bacterium]|nr:hypothetical protein [Streptosporangiales bacterium]